MKANRTVIYLATLNILLVAVLLFKHINPTLPDSLAPAALAQSTSAQAALSLTDSRRTVLVDVAERLAPSIVSVGTTRNISPSAFFFRDFLIYNQGSVKDVPYLGSGVIVDPDGLIVTNYHVVENLDEVFVTLNDGQKLDGKVVDADVALDIALIKVNGKGKNLKPATMGDSDDLMVGEWTLAMGNPFGNLISDPIPTVTAGVVSALSRNFRPNENLRRVYLDMIQTDAAINPGNSGGALVNAAGEVIGINTFIMSRSGGAEGIGFAIPINRVKAVVKEITEHGSIRPRLVDFNASTLDANMAEMLDTEAEYGAVVTRVNTTGPAQKAGLKVGDVITSVNSRRVTDAEELNLKIWYTGQVGSTVKLQVDRAGKKLELDYTLAAPPDKK